MGDEGRRAFGRRFKGGGWARAPRYRLTSNAQNAERIEPVHVKLGGIITLAAGVGVCVLIGAKALADARAHEQPRNRLP